MNTLDLLRDWGHARYIPELGGFTRSILLLESSEVSLRTTLGIELNNEVGARK